jgi:hypothetical protein
VEYPQATESRFVMDDVPDSLIEGFIRIPDHNTRDSGGVIDGFPIEDRFGVT